MSSEIELKPDFGSTIRKWRETRGISQRRFAETVGLSPTYLSKIERGEMAPPAEPKVIAIADAMERDRDELLALAGRIASDLPPLIRANPRQMAALVRNRGIQIQSILQTIARGPADGEAWPEWSARIREDAARALGNGNGNGNGGDPFVTGATSAGVKPPQRDAVIS